ncbi:STAS domain-containing protein [Pseudomonas sp. EA_35y_Pfl2_R5]|uniref:STAS domain-containing protein n=1 Tax=Pseudomonas sp. EA_35y_Pfl2_R5 TaxID=3088690 RepID=UPI0030D88CCA
MYQLTTHDTAAYSLSGSLTIYEARDAHQALLAAVAEPAPGVWTLDIQALEELDSAGVQLLLALDKHLRQYSAELQLLQPGPELRDLLDLLRLQVLYRASPSV